MKIAFIGGGNMGEAMLSAVLNKRLGLPQDIAVSDIDESRRQHLQQQYNVGVTGDNRLAVSRAEVVILAIKPQNLTRVMAELKEQLRATQLVLSIIAGAKIDTLRDGLNHGQVVRAMPNTPARIGQGITVWTAAGVAKPQKQWATAILETIGQEIYVEDEKYLDMATAISGSGPAYFFLFIEVLAEAAMRIGLPREIAQQLALETMLGAGHLIKESGQEPAELRRMVTSPGGTTAEALRVLEQGGFADLLTKAIEAAYDKARSLGGEPQ